MTPRTERRVRFTQQQGPSFAPCNGPNNGEPLFSELTLETCQELWYQPGDLEVFKAEARKLLIHGCGDEDEYSGLERYSCKRTREKAIAIRYILSAQKRKGATDEVLSVVAQTCNAWAQEIAFLQGFKDYCQVYGQDPPSKRSSFSVDEEVLEELFEDEVDFTEQQQHTVRKHPLRDDCQSNLYGEREVRQRTALTY